MRSASRHRGPPARSSSGPPARARRPPATTSSPIASKRSAARHSAGVCIRRVPLPSGHRADALSIPVRESLGLARRRRRWRRPQRRRRQRGLAGTGRAGRRSPRRHRSGRPDPAQRQADEQPQPSMPPSDGCRRWSTTPSSTNSSPPCPGRSSRIARADARSTTLAVLGAVVDAIVSEAAGFVTLPAPPPGDDHGGGRLRSLRHPAGRFDLHGAGRRDRRRQPPPRAVDEVGHRASPARSSSSSSIHRTAATPGSCRCSARARRAGCCRSRSHSATAGRPAR